MAMETQAETQAENQRYAELGRAGGLSISDAKRAAARLNGKKGGRPPKDRRSRILKLWNSSADENWGTPQSFFDKLNTEFRFTLDAAASATNAKCARYYTKEDNALMQPWSDRVWCNPPYSATMTPAFMQKASTERNNCQIIVILVPARTSTQWWRDTVWDGELAKRGVTVRFPPRLKNDKRNHPSKSEKRWPFPCALVIFRPDAAPCIIE
jgi:phage N-6-adenine-methyltransferase